MIGVLWRLVALNLLGNLWRLVVGLLRAPFRIFARPPRWVSLTLRRPLAARPRPGFLGRRSPSLAGLAGLARALGKDRHLEGVIVRIEGLDGGWARLEDLRGVLAGLRAAGKRVVVHLSSPGLPEYLLACAGDAILMDESGPLTLLGLSSEVTFYGGALEKAGVRAETEYRGAYKSFAETFTRRDMSPAHREAADAILDGLDAYARASVATGRKLDEATAGARLTGGPYMAADAERLALIDAVRYPDEIEAWLAAPAGGAPPAKAPRAVDAAAWRRARPTRLRWAPLRPRRRVRVLALHGTIVEGEGGPLPRRALAAAPAVRAVDACRRDPRVAAVVLHVDSRGGSAAGSDRIWREVVRLGREKPVVAYLGDVAASGGYYLACGATRVVCQPTTLTGSIGVVAGKLDLSGLYARLGLGVTILTRGEAAALHSAAKGLSQEERRRLAAEVDALYRQFVGKVAEGRRLAPEAAEAAAQGRVWLGRDALARGLVDTLGGVDAAIDAAKELARRKPGERFQVDDARPGARRQGLLWRLLGDAVVRSAGPLGGLLSGEGSGPRGGDLEPALWPLLAGERTLCWWGGDAPR